MTNKIKLTNLIFTRNDTVILALSGGRDSMTLLHLLEDGNYKFVIAHINHHKRKESDFEEEYIYNYAKVHNIPIEIGHFRCVEKDNFQALAHKFRYNFFYETARKYHASYILTAHHADDNAETILLRLISGSNLYGYGGISKLVPFRDIFLYRPLLSYSREDINAYVKENNITYFEDDSNNHDDYLRNRIRHEILPLFKKENPNLLASLTHYSIILKESFNYIRKNTLAYLNGKLEIYLPTYIKLDEALQKDILVYLLEQHNIKPSFKIITTLVNLLKNKRPQLDYNLGNNLIFAKRYEIASIKEMSINNFDSIILNRGETKIFLSKYKFYLTENISNSNAKYLKLWYNESNLPLVIRTREPGDYLQFKFGKKKVKDFFIDKKIEKEKRDTYPLILDSTGKIIAIFDLINLSKGDKYIYLVCEVKDE